MGGARRERDFDSLASALRDQVGSGSLARDPFRHRRERKMKTGTDAVSARRLFPCPPGVALRLALRDDATGESAKPSKPCADPHWLLVQAK